MTLDLDKLEALHREIVKGTMPAHSTMQAVLRHALPILLQAARERDAIRNVQCTCEARLPMQCGSCHDAVMIRQLRSEHDEAVRLLVKARGEIEWLYGGGDQNGVMAVLVECNDFLARVSR